MPHVNSPLLPLVDAEIPERCDAARNRKLLLDAAADLVAERGVDAVTMEAVAAKAGVGKGTVFRRFGSRSGLMNALLDHTERELQHAFMFGPAPLGPDAPPLDRLIAFGRARLDMVTVQGDVLRAAEGSPDVRFGGPARAVSLRHVVTLLQTRASTVTWNCSPSLSSPRSKPASCCTRSGCSEYRPHASRTTGKTWPAE